MFRGILALSVALYHANVFHIITGRTAVICFFGLSGWCIAASYKDISSFYLKRIVRLAPVLTASFVLTTLFCVSNRVLWTLLVQIQFYIFVPLLLLVFPRKRHLVIYALLFILPRLFIEDSRSLVGNLCYFYAGIWLYQNPLDIPLEYLKGLIPVCFGFTLFGGWFGANSAILGCLFVIEFCQRVEFKKNVLYFLGLISYGYFVYHGFCYGLMEGGVIEVETGTLEGFAVLVLMPIPMAILSYWLVEK